MLAKFNCILKKIVVPLNVINLLVGILVAIAHVYLQLPSLPGLLLGILSAISGSLSIAINQYFIAKKAGDNINITTHTIHTHKSNLFLSLMIPTLLLNAASTFFSMYTGTLLTATALAIPLSSPVIVSIAAVTASLMAIATTINSWLQVHDIWESLKAPAVASYSPVILIVDRQTPDLVTRLRRTQSCPSLRLFPDHVDKQTSMSNNRPKLF